ncbi:MFS general substrate transporter [Rhizodiscina lignyota]|uniref:MFS general substrate transporter n=1 Tax=Rhizodiscina lignyota TaxID=1504668 RepID=A0A9P4MAU1_9PEZI|nr:MFS general substrate transporter [Rhizodiscina lignyota]
MSPSDEDAGIPDASLRDDKQPTENGTADEKHHPKEQEDEEESRDNGALDKDVEKQAEPQETALDGTKSHERDENIVDWDGDDDPHNPYNWSKGKKWTNGGLLSAMTLVTPLASSMFAPGVPDVMREFQSTSTILASLVVSVYILGYAFGPLIIAPMSELYGRTIVYHVSNVLFVVFSIACAVSSNLGMLIGFRFLAGSMGSTPLTIGGGTNADMFRTEERGAAMAIWSIGPLLGPVIGPVAGSYLSQAKGWHWDFWLITILGGTITIFMMIFLRETYAPRILELKARRLRKETGNPNLRSKLDTGLSPRELFIRSIVRPTKMLLFSPIVFLLSFYMAVVYGYLYLLFTTMTLVFENTYHFSQGSVGLSYLGIGVGMFGGLFLTGATSDWGVKYLSRKNGGVTKPEFRLPPMIPAALLIPIGLFIYGWTAQFGVHWIVPIIGTSFVGLGLITTFMPIMTYLIDAYTIYSASCIAANTVLRSLLGALLPLAGPSMYSALGLGWGNSLLGFVALAMAPLPIIFWRYGERIRTSRRFTVNF